MVAWRGSYCTYTPSDHQLKANNHCYFEFSIQSAPFRFLSDGLNDAFIQTLINDETQILPVAVSPIVLASPYRERTEVPEVDAAPLALIPQPNSVIAQDGAFTLTPNSVIAIASTLANDASDWFKQELRTHFELSLPEQEVGAITFRACLLYTSPSPRD